MSVERRVLGRLRGRTAAVLAVLVLVVTAAACRTPEGPGGDGGSDAGFGRLLRGAQDAPWSVRPGVEQITVTGAQPGEPLTLYGSHRQKLLTLLADRAGQAQFAYLPPDFTTLQSGAQLDYSKLDVPDGTTVAPGRYAIVDEAADPRLASEVVTVLSRDDVPDTALYDRQHLTGAALDVLGNVAPGSSLEDGFHYLGMRDGVKLSAMVRFPDRNIYGPGPWPTVIEYSGYGPSNPASEEAGVRLARALGFATVAVNLRGSGCSGGVFDVFNPAQMADGYDTVEIVARQPWVRDHKVGMVGLSYSGITQLYTATTNPPDLAAVTPQSVIADPWLEAWPGGIFNSGFTQQWLKQRDAESAPGGTDWVSQRIADGDTTCRDNLALRSQNPDFEKLIQSLPTYSATAAARDLRELVRTIKAPVYLTGAFQDEQTGPQFGAMVDNFDSTRLLRVTMWNGRHPDGYAPINLVRWYEFLELYVADQVPKMNPLVRAALPGVLAGQFHLKDVQLEPDHFAQFGDDLAAARAAYEHQDPVRVVFESGLGQNEVGEAGGTFELTFKTWPTPQATAATWYLGPDETLSPTRPGRDRGADAFRFDPGAGGSTLFGGTGDYPLLDPLWNVDWTRFPAGDELSYVTPAFTKDTVLAGPGYVDLYVASDADKANVQVTVSEIRPDGTESLLQNGWLNLADRAEDRKRTNGLEIVHLFTAKAQRPLMPGKFVEARIDLPAFAAPVRAGSRLRLSIATPGRNHATWEFQNPDYGGKIPTTTVARTRAMPSALVLSVLPGVTVPPAVSDPLPCPGLRGQACRPFVPTVNLAGKAP